MCLIPKRMPRNLEYLAFIAGATGATGATPRSSGGGDGRRGAGVTATPRMQRPKVSHMAEEHGRDQGTSGLVKIGCWVSPIWFMTKK